MGNPALAMLPSEEVGLTPDTPLALMFTALFCVGLGVGVKVFRMKFRPVWFAIADAVPLAAPLVPVASPDGNAMLPRFRLDIIQVSGDGSLRVAELPRPSLRLKLTSSFALT